ELLGGADRGGGYAVRLGAEPLLARRAGGGGRDPPGLRAARNRDAAVLPARERAAHREVHARSRGDRGAARRTRNPGRAVGSPRGGAALRGATRTAAARRRDRRARRDAGRRVGDRGRDEAGAGGRQREGGRVGTEQR